MGQFLEKPNTDKESHSGVIQDPNISYALSSMQGWRMHMEDAHVHVTNIPDMPGVSFFAVFDGHGGKTVAVSGAKFILNCITSTQVIREAPDKTDANVIAKATREGLFKLDDEIKKNHEELRQGYDRSGSTVVVLFLTPTHYIIANCGDSRVFLASNDTVKFSSDDHKPTKVTELERIKKAGGFVEMGRVNGTLAVSRALGDYEYKDRQDLPVKDQKITCDPDMTVLQRSDKDNFIVMACDGIWDVCHNEHVLTFVNFYLEKGYTSIQIAEKLLDFCLEKGSRDNMSVLILTLPAARQAKQQLPSSETDEQREVRIEQENKALYDELAKITVMPDGSAISTPPPTSTCTSHADEKKATQTSSSAQSSGSRMSSQKPQKQADMKRH
eukprot:gene3291-5982_t